MRVRGENKGDWVTGYDLTQNSPNSTNAAVKGQPPIPHRDPEMLGVNSDRERRAEFKTSFFLKGWIVYHFHTWIAINPTHPSFTHLDYERRQRRCARFINVWIEVSGLLFERFTKMSGGVSQLDNFFPSSLLLSLLSLLPFFLSFSLSAPFVFPR